MIALSSVVTVYVASNVLRDLLGGNAAGPSTTHLSLLQLIDQHAIEYGWILKFGVNCFGYACVFVPGILVYLYTQRIKYLERCSKFKFKFKILVACR